MPLKAFRIHEENGRVVARYETLELNDLSPGDVVIRVSWSDINYKDALAATGAGKILRRYPLVGGIDLAGVVEAVERCALPAGRSRARHRLRSFRNARWRLRGARAGARRCGRADSGRARRAHGRWRIGTAGFTAALAIHRMEANGQTPSLGAHRGDRCDGRRRQSRHRHAVVRAAIEVIAVVRQGVGRKLSALAGRVPGSASRQHRLRLEVRWSARSTAAQSTTWAVTC